MTKTHFAVPATGGGTDPSCGRGFNSRRSDSVSRVDCIACRRTPEFQSAEAEDSRAREAAFMAQEPRTFGEPWREGIIVCRECQGDTFRRGDRTCYGHYENFHCASCGHVESRLTETGMSF